MNSFVRCLHSFPNGDRSKNTKPPAPCRVLSAVLLLCTAEPPFLRMRCFPLDGFSDPLSCQSGPISFIHCVIFIRLYCTLALGSLLYLLVVCGFGCILSFYILFFLPPVDFLNASSCTIVVSSVGKYNVQGLLCTVQQHTAVIMLVPTPRGRREFRRKATSSVGGCE